MSFESSFYRLLPRWLTTGEGELVLKSLTRVVDEWLLRLREGALATMPDHAPDDALGLIGRDRKIVRGLDEPREGYALRLKRWLDDHRVRGGPIAFLQQVGAYWDHSANGPYRMTLIYRSGVRFERAIDGSISPSLGTWEVDDEPERWARWWLILHWHEDETPARLWGSGDWGDPGVWGSGMSAELAEQLRLVPHEWNAAHCKGRIGLLGPGAELWGVPVGEWGEPGSVWGGGTYSEIGVQ